MLPVTEPSSRKEHREVVGPMRVPVSQVAGHHHHGGIEKVARPFFGAFQLREQAPKRLDQIHLHLPTRGEFFRFLAVVGEIVVHPERHEAHRAC